MKRAGVVLRVLLGVIFLVFGSNGFLQFLPMPPLPQKAGAFFGALTATGYMIPLIMSTEVVAAALLIAGVWVPFALVMLAPVIVNIILFHVFLAPSGIPLAIVVAALEFALVLVHRQAFAPLARPRR
jgi:putative oxidoreductase